MTNLALIGSPVQDLCVRHNQYFILSHIEGMEGKR
jgi:hypothetical protein